MKRGRKGSVRGKWEEEERRKEHEKGDEKDEQEENYEEDKGEEAERREGRSSNAVRSGVMGRNTLVIGRQKTRKTMEININCFHRPFVRQTVDGRRRYRPHWTKRT